MGFALTPIAAVAAIMFGITSGTLFDSFVKTDFYNGMSQVKELTTEADLSGQPLAVIYITSDNPEAVPAELRNLAEILQTRESPVNVYCATPSVLTDSSLGQLLIIRNGRRLVYYGVREASAILKFLSHLNSTPLKTITGKVDKVAFDNCRGTKLVGYFAPGTAELQTFQQAADLFGTQVSFYVVTDPAVATHLKLNATGQIHLIREFDKQPVPCQANPATLADIQQLIVFNRDSLVKVTPLNVLDPALTSSSAIVLITDTSPLSYHVLKLITRTQRQHALTTTTTKPVSRLLWLDTGDFPTFNLASMGLTKLPGLGFWDVEAKTTQWMDMLTLNGSPTDKVAEEANLLLVKAFLAAHPTAASSAQTAKSEL